MPQIVLSPMSFYSQGDEHSLFQWIKEIKGIAAVRGVHTSVVLHFRSSRISDKSLRELIGLFSRYRFKNMAQLVQFQNQSNKSWFNDVGKFWPRKVFKGNQSSK